MVVELFDVLALNAELVEVRQAQRPKGVRQMRLVSLSNHRDRLWGRRFLVPARLSESKSHDPP